MIGNPGIGKSWWHWQYLLYSLRPDVYSELSGDQQFPPNFHEDSLPPSVVIRYDAGNDTAVVYYLRNQTACVHLIENLSNPYLLLARLDRPDTTFMFEPGKSIECVPYEGLVDVSIIATVSPDASRYKEFGKNGGMSYYLPCPSIGEIVDAATTCAFAWEELFSVTKIIERIDEIGPFPRYVLTYFKEALVNTAEKRKAAINNIRAVLTIQLYNDWRPLILCSHSREYKSKGLCG